MRLDESLMIEKEDNLGCRLITEDMSYFRVGVMEAC